MASHWLAQGEGMAQGAEQSAQAGSTVGGLTHTDCAGLGFSDRLAVDGGRKTPQLNALCCPSEFNGARRTNDGGRRTEDG